LTNSSPAAPAICLSRKAVSRLAFFDSLKYYRVVSEYVVVCASDYQKSGNKDLAATRSSLIDGLHDWGDQNSWQEFFDTYWKLIYSVAIKAGLSESEARDVVQETVVAVAKQVRDGGYDRKRGSFRNWLCLITRRRIIDHLRQRTDPKFRHVPGPTDPTRTETIARVPDPGSLGADEVWEVEWQKNLLDVAIERVRQQVAPRQFQIFDLSVMRELPVSEVTQLLKVNAAQVYLARHRVGALVKKEVQRLEARSEDPSALRK
jgi:RNA polymerase sigma factor (sigma-70 family)